MKWDQVGQVGHGISTALGLSVALPVQYRLNEKSCCYLQVPTEFRIPLPMVTILQSGRAAPGKSNCIKEYMVVPKPGKDLKEVRQECHPGHLLGKG